MTACLDRYDRPVLFFEESYPCDGVEIGDVALMDRVAELVGKENIFVKIHPPQPGEPL